MFEFTPRQWLCNLGTIAIQNQLILIFVWRFLCDEMLILLINNTDMKPVWKIGDMFVYICVCVLLAKIMLSAFDCAIAYKNAFLTLAKYTQTQH